MRLLAFLATLVALAAVAFAGQALWRVWQAPLPPPGAQTATAPPESAPGSGAERQPPRGWPALFGAEVVPEPQPPRPPEPEPEPQPPAPPVPPLESLGFVLQGVVSDGDNRWAIVTHPTGERLIRVGDVLGNDYTVVRIDEAGLWAAPAAGAEPRLLGFAK